MFEAEPINLTVHCSLCSQDKEVEKMRRNKSREQEEESFLKYNVSYVGQQMINFLFFKFLHFMLSYPHMMQSYLRVEQL